jgi:hypothetical protein
MRCLNLMTQGKAYCTRFLSLQIRKGALCTGISSNLLHNVENLASNLLHGMESLTQRFSHLLPIVDSTYVSECLRNIFHTLSVQLHWSSDLQLVYLGKDVGPSSPSKKFTRYVSYY